MQFDLSMKKLCELYKITYKRYSDDIIIICDKADVNLIQNEVTEKINELKLSIQKEKTEVIDISYKDRHLYSHKR